MAFQTVTALTGQPEKSPKIVCAPFLSQHPTNPLHEAAGGVVTLPVTPRQ